MKTQAPSPRPEFNQYQRANMLTEVDFKWLLAGMGIWIDPNKFHQDPLYAQARLENAMQSQCEPLRRCATTLKLELEHES